MLLLRCRVISSRYGVIVFSETMACYHVLLYHCHHVMLMSLCYCIIVMFYHHVMSLSCDADVNLTPGVRLLHSALRHIGVALSCVHIVLSCVIQWIISLCHHVGVLLCYHVVIVHRYRDVVMWCDYVLYHVIVSLQCHHVMLVSSWWCYLFHQNITWIYKYVKLILSWHVMTENHKSAGAQYVKNDDFDRLLMGTLRLVILDLISSKTI